MTRKLTPLFWQSELIGYIADTKIDSFRLYANWIPSNKTVVKKFMEMLVQSDRMWVGLDKNQPTHYVSSESFSELNGEATIKLISGTLPPESW